MTTVAPAAEAPQTARPAPEAPATIDIPLPAPGQAVQLGVDAETGEIVLPGGTVPAPGEQPTADAPPVHSGPPPAVDPESVARAQDVIARLKAKRRAQLERQAAEQHRAQQLASLQHGLTAEQQARKALEERLRQAQDPNDLMAALRARGQDPGKVLAQAAVDANSPEGQIAALKRELEETRGQLRGFVQTEEQRRHQQMIEQGRERVAQMAMTTMERDDEGKFTEVPAFPHAARAMRVARPAAIAEYERLWRVARGNGFNPTPEQILNHMESQYEAIARGDAKLAGNASAAESGATPPAQEKPTGKPAAAAARTVARKTNERPTTPRSFDDLDPDEQIEAMMEQARKLQQAG